MQRKILISSLAVGCLLAALSTLWAQDTNAPSTNTQPRIQTLPPARQQGILGILSDEQRSSYQSATTAQRAKLIELQSKLQVAQRETFEAALSPQYDENLVRQKAAAAGQIFADMLVLRTKPLSEIKPPLSVEQIEKLKTVPSPGMNPRVLPGATPAAGTNRDENGLPPKQ